MPCLMDVFNVSLQISLKDAFAARAAIDFMRFAMRTTLVHMSLEMYPQYERRSTLVANLAMSSATGALLNTATYRWRRGLWW